MEFELKVSVSVYDTYVSIDIERGYATSCNYMADIKSKDDVSKVVSDCVGYYIKKGIL